MGYKNQDKSWRHGTWCSLHLTLNTESLGGGSVSRYSGKLVCTLSALELSALELSALELSALDFILPGKGYMTTTKVLADKDFSSILFHYVSFLEQRIHQRS